MSQVVTTPDGAEHEFPDGTQPAVMQAALSKYVAQNGGPASPAAISGIRRMNSPRAMTARWLRMGPYVGGAIGGTVAGVPGATVGGMAGRAAEQALTGTLPRSPKEAVDTIGGAGVEQGVQQVAGNAIAGGMGLAASGLGRVAGWADRRAGNMAVARVRAAYNAAAPSAAAQAAADESTALHVAGVREATARTVASTREASRTGVAAVREGMRREGRAVAETTRGSLSGAKNVEHEIGAATEASVAARADAAAATDAAIKAAHEAGAKPVSIQEITDHIIQNNEARFGPMTTEDKAAIFSEVANRHAEVLPEYSLGAVKGTDMEHALPTAQFAKQSFQRNAHPELGAIARGKQPKPDIDLAIASAYQKAIEDRVPEIAELNRTTQAAIRDVQGIKTLAGGQPTPSVRRVAGMREHRMSGVRSRGTEQAAGVRRRGADEAAGVRRNASESAAAARARADAEIARIKAEHESRVAALRLEKAEAVARAMATTPGPSELASVHLGVAPGVRMGTPRIAPLARGTARVVGSRAARGTARQVPRGIAALRRAAAPDDKKP